jgi:type IV pilus assembly protein PilF
VTRSSLVGTIIRSWSSRFIVAVLLVGMVQGCATPEETVKKSQGYYQEGIATLDSDKQKSYVSFQKAIQVNPNNKEAHYGLGYLLAEQGKWVQAEEHFRAALDIDQDYSEAHTFLGKVLESQDRWPEAIQEYRQALTNPLYATPDLARFHLGRALAHEGDYQGAMEALEDALMVTPPHVRPAGAPIHLELGRVYYKLGFERRAKEALTKVTTLDKNGEYGAAAKELLAKLK